MAKATDSVYGGIMAEKPKKKWSKEVTEHSHALDTEKNIFSSESPDKIAASLKKSALESKNRKSSPFQSAMSMLNFYINRAGKKLSKHHKEILERAKDKLRDLFNKKT
jgi:hypothetical protein